MVIIKVNKTLAGILASLHLFASVGEANDNDKTIEARLVKPLYVGRIDTGEVILGGGLYSINGRNESYLEAYFRICNGEQLGNNPYLIILRDGTVLVDYPLLGEDRLQFNRKEIDMQKAVDNAPPCPAEDFSGNF